MSAISSATCGTANSAIQTNDVNKGESDQAVQRLADRFKDAHGDAVKNGVNSATRNVQDIFDLSHTNDNDAAAGKPQADFGQSFDSLRPSRVDIKA